MAGSSFYQPPAKSITTAAAVEPIRNVLVGMSQITAAGIDRKPESWLAKTAGSLSDEQRQHNHLIFENYGSALLPRREYTDFLAYVDGLAAVAPQELHRRAADLGSPEQPTRKELLRHFDDPSTMQRLIVDHLRMLWHHSFASLWKRKLNTLNYMAAELDARPWPTTSAGNALRAFMRRELPDAISAQLNHIRHIVFVPSPFVDLYGSRMGTGSTLWLFMAADPWTLPMRNEPVRRSETLRPLQALADETRLQILELLAAYDELTAQEIIARLDVTQSTVSRHLKQLQRVDLVSETRGTGANKQYRFHSEGIDHHHQTLKTLLSKENARLVLNDLRLDQPEALRRFLDRQVRITDWPSKLKDQRQVLEYLITKFEFATDYSEKEVTDLLDQWHTYGNPAYLRRSLVDFGLLSRTSNGARYWRTDEEE